ncbi:MAG: hypothetical protein WCA30_00540 [Dermatophilaceae bacterium]
MHLSPCRRSRSNRLPCPHARGRGAQSPLTILRRKLRCDARRGEPGVYCSSTNLYLYTEDRGLKFWCMWSHEPEEGDAALVNLATTERSYVDQRAIDLGRVRRLRLSMPALIDWAAISGDGKAEVERGRGGSESQS